jgi:hypothetical protein
VLEEDPPRDREVLLNVVDDEKLAHAAGPASATSAACFLLQICERSASSR